MPDDLLEFVGGPPGYSPVWLWLGLALILAVVGSYVALFVATLPSRRLRGIPGVRTMHARVLRHRFARTVRRITEQHRRGELSGAAASAAIGRTLRSFLHQATGRRAQYMQVHAIAAGELSAAAPVLTALGDARFDRDSAADVGRLGDETEELIRSWD
ncbi:MAG: hypothetical protein SW019_13725 [Actinomycetota bacterium]|nr:hypothetical protein [Actinomycetota bacterium]